MTMYLIYTIFLGLLCTIPCASKSYKKHTLFRGIPETEEQLAFFKNVTEWYEGQFWRAPGLTYRPVEFIIGPEKKNLFLRDAVLKGIYFTIMIEDVQKAFDSQTVKAYDSKNIHSFDWSSFFNLDDIYEWLQDLKYMYPNVIDLKKIGKTYQSRDILAARIFLPGGKKKPKVIVEGGIHSQEWISIAFVTYFLHQVLTSVHIRNSKLKEIAIEYEWFFVPVVNPDGYVYTHNTDRMYRKNMRAVDLNRNFDIHFGTVETSANIHSETYPGPNAFSEAESIALAEFIKANSKDLKFYLAFHSYGQHMIIPYAHSKTREQNFDEVHEIGINAAFNISKRYGTEYTVGTTYDTVGYLTSGMSGCWVKKTFSVPYVLTFELRDDGQHGFALPPSEILPTCQETMDGLLTVLDKKTHPKDTIISKNPKKYIISGQDINILCNFVIAWNVLLFIIVL